MRKRAWPVPPMTEPASSFSVDVSAGRVECSAGASPNKTAVTAAAASANAMTRAFFKRQYLQQHAAGPPRHDQPKDRATAGEQQALDEALAHDRSAARPERQTNGHLLLACGAAREQQVRNVGAGDEQHEPDHPHQHENRRRELISQIGSSLLTGPEEQALGKKALLEGRREPLTELHFLFIDLAIDHVHRGFGLRHVNARFQPRQQREPPTAPILEVVPRWRHLCFHHDRHHDVRRFADDDSRESGLYNADDRHRVAVQIDCPVEDARVAGEATHPIVVAQYDDGMCPGHAVVAGREGPANDGANAQHVEIVAADEFAADAFGLAVGHQRQRSGKPRHDSAENGVAVAEIAVHRVREGVAVELPAGERPRVLEKHEPIRVLHGQ